MENKQVKPKWPTMFYNDTPRTGLDYSRNTEDIFEEIPPYAKDENGKFLNETSEPIIKKTGVINIQEKIDSYKDEVDIYKILARVAASGDDSLLNIKQGVYGDYSSIPDNINDFTDYVSNNIELLKSMPKELSSLIIKDDFNEDEFYRAVEDYNNKNNKKEVEKKDE